MQHVNEKSHYATVISSLNKEYYKVRVGKQINAVDIYLLDITFNLLNGSELTLLDSEIECLLDIYSVIINSSKNICINTYLDTCKSDIKSKFIQADNTDCGSIGSETDVEIVLNRVYYWQEDSILNKYEDIIPEIGNRIKQDDTLSAFNIGKTISYSNIGRVCFLIDNTLPSDEYSLYDILDNNVTSAFSRYYDTTEKYTVFISNNIYAYGDILFKIKKTGTDFSVFNNLFNNLFS